MTAETGDVYLRVSSSVVSNGGTNFVIFDITVSSEPSSSYVYKNIEYIADANVQDVTVRFENPLWQNDLEGNKINVGPESRVWKGIFVKFDKMVLRFGNTAIEKTWSDCKTDLNVAAQIAPDSTPDTILLSVYSYGYQILIYNFKTSKFEIALSRYALPDSCIIIAYPYNGTGMGELCNKINVTLAENDYIFSHTVRRAFLDTIREAEVGLLGSGENFCMILSTDVHYWLTEDKFVTNVTNAVVKELDNNFHADALVNCGDSMLYGTKFKQYGLTALLNIFREIDNDRLVYAVGNHDFNSVADGGTTTNKEDWIITDAELTSLVNRHAKATSRPAGKLYYYRDYTDKKTRIIVLNTMDV